ncbi:hypothetical protein [Legionella impletisoli]|uniref:Uncharacterized protein n=1 Tax=Legionella impletisoli TaxID=343510 RepID=A0A917JSW9_9GAMM|nr:hypothetical protein [Legionella impletisoli]GGI82948.1 hypothetical protein GCM10007966_09370 [Legionella impletisoli]
MLTPEVLNTTKASLSISGDKQRTDPDFGKYESGLSDFFNRFIADSAVQPDSLEYIRRQIAGDGFSASFDKASSNKMTWSSIFALAALATMRKNTLPLHSPERTFLETLLNTLSNGWVEGFTRFMRPKQDLLENIKSSLNQWIEQYDVELENPTQTKETLLSLYAIVCSLEKTMNSNRFVSEDLKSWVRDCKTQIEAKYNTFEAKQSLQASHVLMEAQLNSNSMSLFTALRQATAREKNKLITYLERLETLDIEQAKRLQDLNQILATSNRSFASFWQAYDTEAKFGQLMDDLSLSDKERAEWREYYNWEHGSRLSKITAAVWSGGWGIPTWFGGIKANALSIPIIQNKVRDSWLKTTSGLLSQVGSLELLEKPGAISDFIQQTRTVTHRTKELMEELEMLEHSDELKEVDIQRLISSQGSFLTDYHDKNLANAYTTFRQTIENIDELTAELEKQAVILQMLDEMQVKLTALKDAGIDMSTLNARFEEVVDEISQKSLNGLLDIEPDVPVGSKLTNAKTQIQDISDSLQNMKSSMIHMASFLQEQKQEEVLIQASDLIDARSNKLGHKILYIFSPSYRRFFKGLKDAIQQEKEQAFEKIAEMFGLKDGKDVKVKKPFNSLKNSVVAVALFAQTNKSEANQDQDQEQVHETDQNAPRSGS